jgi:hypothetical protein
MLYKFWVPIRVDIPEVFQRVGAAHEAYYARNIRAPIFGAEVPCKGEVGNIQYSGRKDFVIPSKTKGNIIVETKASVMEKTIKNVAHYGKLKLNQLAQLIFYMIREKQTFGKLVFGGYKELEGGLFEQVAFREFKVEFGKSGEILVDGKAYKFTVQDQLQHQLNSAKALDEEIVWDRPADANAKFGSPCHFCMYKEVCNKYDLGEITTKKEISKFITKEVKEKEEEKAMVAKNQQP